MSVRLLSFLTAVENALQAGASLPDRRKLEIIRVVDYQRGLARMNLQARGAEKPEPRGHIQLQQCSSTDGRTCIKVSLGWSASGRQAARDLFGAAGTDWAAEAKHVAEAWIEGMSAGTGAGEASLAAAG